MFITVNGTILNVTDCYAYRYNDGKLVLKIIVPQTEIGHDALKVLLKTNEGDIVKNNEGQLETYSGFRYTLTILDRDDVYECEVECVSETERKVGDLKNEVSNQELTISELREIIEEQREMIDTQVEALNTFLTIILPELLDSLGGEDDE